MPGASPIRHWRVSFFPVDLGRGGLGVAHTVVETTECTCIESALTDLGLHILKPDDGESLTSREAEVLTLIGQGRTTKEIAAVLRISPETVGNHRKQICRKLQLHSTAEIVSYAARGFRTSAVQIS